MIYLDNAATTLIKPYSVINACNLWLAKYGANPGRGGHKLSLNAGNKVYECRELIAKLFNITLDDLLRAEEVITIAENENKENISRFASLIDGIFNTTAIVGLLLPLYKVELNNVFYSVPLHQFQGWLAVLYWIFPVAMAICGIIQIMINKSEREKIKRSVNAAGLILNACAIFILIFGGQPYPAAMFFTLLLIKGAVLVLKR